MTRLLRLLPYNGTFHSFSQLDRIPTDFWLFLLFVPSSLPPSITSIDFHSSRIGDHIPTRRSQFLLMERLLLSNLTAKPFSPNFAPPQTLPSELPLLSALLPSPPFKVVLLISPTLASQSSLSRFLLLLLELLLKSSSTLNGKVSTWSLSTSSNRQLIPLVLQVGPPIPTSLLQTLPSLHGVSLLTSKPLTPLFLHTYIHPLTTSLTILPSLPSFFDLSPSFSLIPYPPLSSFFVPTLVSVYILCFQWTLQLLLCFKRSGCEARVVRRKSVWSVSAS